MIIFDYLYFKIYNITSKAWNDKGDLFKPMFTLILPLWIWILILMDNFYSHLISRENIALIWGISLFVLGLAGYARYVHRNNGKRIINKFLGEMPWLSFLGYIFTIIYYTSPFVVGFIYAK